MPARTALLSQAELTRYAKALREAGVAQWRVEVDPVTRKVSIIAGSLDPEAGPNPCDRLLK